MEQQPTNVNGNVSEMEQCNMSHHNAADENGLYYVGLMSGTSVDGIDAAVVKIVEAVCDTQQGTQIAANGVEHAGANRLKVELLAFANTPFPEHVRKEIFQLFDPKQATIDKVGTMNMWLGELYSQATYSIIEQAGLRHEQITAIGSHGQTIYHAPQHNIVDGFNLHFTVQIGEGAVIANRTGIPCVSDFRIADMAAGGQGAPLVPFTEHLLYAEQHETLLLQNIGGIGNITVLPAGGEVEKVFAFDTGPGNMIIDGLVAKLFPPLTMDISGKLAAQGQLIDELLHWMQSDSYYSMNPPKSTGREHYGEQYVAQIIDLMNQNNWKPHDVIATATYVTAWSIAESYRLYVQPICKAHRILIGGGGSYNDVLVAQIRELLAPYGITTMIQEDIGGNSDAKEAIAFALLAHYSMQRLPNNLPSVTGASEHVVMGKISWPSRSTI